MKLKDKRYIPENSSMVKDERELLKHSKIMEHMNTNTELEKEHLQPDPKQYRESDIKK